MSTQLVDLHFSLGELSIVLSVLFAVWKLYYPLAKILILFDEFPPHKHLNGVIIFPKGMTPGGKETV